MSYDPLSRETGVRRRVAPSIAGSDDPSIPYDTQGLHNVYHQPGRPIGFFAARGTPYQKKIISKKLLIFNFCILPILGIIGLVLICLPILYAIAVHTLNVTVMHIHSSNITEPTEDSMTLTIEGQVMKAGVFPAQLYFREPVYVKWVTPPPELKEVVLGNMTLDRIGVAANHGRIKQVTTFHVMDKEAFAKFSVFLITKESFTWRLICNNLHVEAFAFLPTWSNLKLTKDVVVNGFDNFKDVKILDFQIPGAHPDGGIAFQATTQLRNPSPFGIQLGRLGVNLSTAEGVYLGPAYSPNVNVTAGINIVQLFGQILPALDNETAINGLGELMTKYINHEVADTVAVGEYAKSPTGELPSWLIKGVRAMTLSVPLQSPEPINPLKSIEIGTFNLSFNNDNPYEPIASSDSLSATMALPFGLPLTIVSTQNSITIKSVDGSQPFISVDGVYSPAATELNLVGPGSTAGKLYLTLKDSPMHPVNQTNEAKIAFQQFAKEFTFVGPDQKNFVGEARALSDTPAGRLLLDGIKFDVQSGLLGLQGLKAKPTNITGVDVVGGTRQGIKLSVNTTIYNPSNVNVGAGDVTLLLSNQDVLGNVLMKDLHLNIGENMITAESMFTPGASPYGYETLNRFVSGLDTKLNISGYDDSTPIPALGPAFSAIRLDTVLPGLKNQIVGKSQLIIANTTGVTNDVAYSKIDIVNPFTADLGITHIKANVTSHGLFIAQADTPMDFTAKGKTMTRTGKVPLHVNLYPPDIFGFVRALALKAGESVERLDAMIALGGYTLSDTTSNARRRRSLERRGMFDGFDLPSYVKKAFTAAEVNMDIVSSCKIGDYETDITFVQRNVNLTADDSIDMLLPVLAKPIVQKIIDGAVLAIDTATIVDPKAKSFGTKLKGKIFNSGPFNAQVKFPDGLQVSWNGKVLGQIAMPDIHLKADVGADIDVQAQFAVADTDALTEFTKFLVTQPSFVWSISSDNIEAVAIGITVGGLSINKNVILTGLNNLKNDVTITKYDLPSNDPKGGIHLVADSVVINPSQIGVELSRFGVNIISNGTVLGPAHAQSGFTLQPLSNTSLPLVGRMVHQDSDEGLAVLSHIFTEVVHGKEVPIGVKGDYAGPSEVSWLNEGIKALNTKTKLPAMHFNVIQAIKLKQMTLDFTKKNSDWAPITSTTNTEAPFSLPFQFPIDIQRAKGDFIDRYKGNDIAVLNVPWSPATTDVKARIMTVRFNNVPFSVYKSKHAEFSHFLADTMRQRNVTFSLHGDADAKANTAAGLVTIRQIPFDVDTTLPGLQNLAARKVTVSDLDVYHGYKSYLLIKLNAYLYNPSVITILVKDTSLPLYFENHNIGTAVIKMLKLEPGLNKVPTDVHYEPHGAENKASGQKMLENYVQGIKSEAEIRGSRSATDVESLKEALSGIKLPTTIPPLHQLLIPNARLKIPKNIAATFKALTSFTLQNPFTASINLEKVKADVVYEGIRIGRINEDLSSNPISAKGHKTITSREVPVQLNHDLKTLGRFVLKLGDDTHTDLGPLRQQLNKLLHMSSTDTTIHAKPDDNPPNCHSGRQFDVLGAIMRSLKGLHVTLNIESTVKIDDYKTDLDIIQEPVAIHTDKTALYLVAVVGKPLVQSIVKQAELSFSAANISRVTNDGFHLKMRGKLINTGPFDAYISFPDGVEVIWEGHKMAKIKMPPICAAADEGVPDLETTGELTITDNKAFTKFSRYILHNKKFTWTITSKKVRVQALNIVFDDVILTKEVSFDAFNNLKGVKITSFDIPGQTSNALKAKAGTTIPSPASLGIDLETATFKIYYDGVYQGWIKSSDLFLAPKSVTPSVLTGQLTERKSDKELKSTGQLFSLYLQGKNQTLGIVGNNVITKENGNKPVKWLSDAFKTLTLHVTLPGHIYKVLYSISIQDLTAKFLKPEHTWAPLTGSNQSLAVFATPLRFDLQPLKASLDAKMSYNNAESAHLKIGMRRVSAGTSGGPDDRETLSLNFDNVPLKALNHDAFSAMFDRILNSRRAKIGLHGSASLIGKTVIGNIPVHGVPFKVVTTLAGLDGFIHKVDLYKTVDITKTTKETIEAIAHLKLQNPSNITIKTNRLSLPLIYKGLNLNRAVLTDKTVKPGLNVLAGNAIVKVPEGSRNDTRFMEFLQKIVQPQTGHGKAELPYHIPLTVDGSRGTSGEPMSPYESLIPALSHVKLDGKLPGLGKRLIQHLDVLIDVLQLFSGPGGLPYGWLYVTFSNNLPVPLMLYNFLVDAYKTDSGYTPYNHPDRYTAFNAWSHCPIPAAKATLEDPGKYKCGPWRNILLTKGLIGSLPVLLHNVDVYATVRGYIGSEDSGYFLPALRYIQIDTDITYSISVGTKVVANVTDISDFITNIIKTIGDLGSDKKKDITGQLLKKGGDAIDDLVHHGFKDLICVLEDLPFSFIHTADCKDDSPAMKTSKKKLGDGKNKGSNSSSKSENNNSGGGGSSKSENGNGGKSTGDSGAKIKGGANNNKGNGAQSKGDDAKSKGGNDANNGGKDGSNKKGGGEGGDSNSPSKPSNNKQDKKSGNDDKSKDSDKKSSSKSDDGFLGLGNIFG